MREPGDRRRAPALVMQAMQENATAAAHRMNVREDHLDVPRSARYAVLGEAAAAWREVWMVCHGYGQLARPFLDNFTSIARPDRLIVAPEALNRFYLDATDGPHGPGSPVGATWMTREDRLREIDDYVRYLDLLFQRVCPPGPTAPARRVGLGFSQGVATLCRWAARGETRLDEVILWAGRIPPEIEVTPGLFHGARVTVVFGERDRYASDDAVAAERDRLRAGGLQYRLLRFDGGHRLDHATLQGIAEEPR